MKTSFELEKLKENKQRLNSLKEKIKELQNNLGLNQKKIESIKLKLQALMNNKNEIEKELDIIKKNHLEAYNDYLLHKKRMIKNNKLNSLIELKRNTYKEAVFAGLSQYQEAIIVDTLESAKQLLQKFSL
jgi:chromosome segregation ATPase